MNRPHDEVSDHRHMSSSIPPPPPNKDPRIGVPPTRHKGYTLRKAMNRPQDEISDFLLPSNISPPPPNKDPRIRVPPTRRKGHTLPPTGSSDERKRDKSQSMNEKPHDPSLSQVRNSNGREKSPLSISELVAGSSSGRKHPKLRSRAVMSRNPDSSRERE